MKASRSYNEDLIKDLKDPEESAAYLNAALEEKNPKAFLLALRNVIEAQGGLTKFSRQTAIHRVSLYKMLSKRGNPEWGSVLSLLKALGIKFRIVSKTRHKIHQKAA
jgi:probable addiction module antidote protein